VASELSSERRRKLSGFHNRGHDVSLSADWVFSISILRARLKREQPCTTMLAGTKRRFELRQNPPVSLGNNVASNIRFDHGREKYRRDRNLTPSPPPVHKSGNVTGGAGDDCATKTRRSTTAAEPLTKTGRGRLLRTAICALRCRCSLVRAL